MEDDALNDPEIDADNIEYLASGQVGELKFAPPCPTNALRRNSKCVGLNVADIYFCKPVCRF
jgi:hypothetical protein